METTTIAEVQNDLNEFQKQALEKAESDLQKLEEELSKKKYLIDLKKDDITLLNSFVKESAPWKFTECLGIVEIEKELKECLKTGNLYIGAMPIEAIYYYLSKVEGKGKNTDATAFASVEDYIRVLKAITSGMERVKADNEKLRNAQFIVSARREGIEPDQSLEAEK